MISQIIKWLFIPLIVLRYFVKLNHPPCRSTTCLIGKTAIITGGSRGLGFETALGLASRGCRLIIACRSDGEKVRQEIIRRTNNNNVHVMYLDLSSFASVREFAKKIHETENKIDILINNAGVGYGKDLKPTEDGYAHVMQVNLMGGFLLTHLLIDLLKKSEGGRIIFLSSILSFIHNLKMDNLKGVKGTKFMDFARQYGNSKLGQIIISHEFSNKLRKYGITSNAVHPGVVMTDIFSDLKNQSIGVTLGLWLTRLICLNPDEGAQVTLTLAMSNKFNNITGKFFGCFGFQPRLAKNADFRKQVWKALEEYTQLTPEERITDE